MVTVRIIRRSSDSPGDGPQLTSGGDFIRGNGSDDAIGFFGSDFDASQVDLRLIFAAAAPSVFAAFGIPRTVPNAEAILEQFLGLPSRVDASDLVEALLRIETAVDESQLGQLGIQIGVFTDPLRTLSVIEANKSLLGLTADWGGNDRIFGEGGNDAVMDLAGRNRLQMDDGDDTLYLGREADNVVDTGGSNTIYDLGGDNYMNIFGEDDGPTSSLTVNRIWTGDGNDTINVLGGRSFISAGDGNNRLRGSDGFDEFQVGSGDDFLEVRGADVPEVDFDGDGIPDVGEDRNFNGVFDDGTDNFFAFANLPGIGFFAQNVVLDTGGSDTVRSTSGDSRQGDDLVVSDMVWEEDILSDPNIGEVRFLTLGAGDFGDDNINLSSGDNFVLDGGGDNRVVTRGGDDFVFTSFFQAGNDIVNTGAGNDYIDVDAGSDLVTPGTGTDQIFLGNDTVRDVVAINAIAELTLSTSTIDTISNFVPGVDLIDARALSAAFVNEFGIALTESAFVPIPSGSDIIMGLDPDGNGSLDFLAFTLNDVSLSDLQANTWVVTDDMA